jgi:hypothetical protein
VQAATDPEHPNEWPGSPLHAAYNFEEMRLKNNGRAAACKCQKDKKISVRCEVFQRSPAFAEMMVMSSETLQSEH